MTGNASAVRRLQCHSWKHGTSCKQYQARKHIYLTSAKRTRVLVYRAGKDTVKSLGEIVGHCGVLFKHECTTKAVY